MGSKQGDSALVRLRLKDGSFQKHPKGVIGYRVAEGIFSAEFLGQVIGARLEGQLVDLMTPITVSGDLQFLCLEDEGALEIFHHSSSHVMAFAVRQLYPKALLGIGPAIKQGYYYDFDNVPLKETDFPKIEERMAEIVQEKLPFTRHVLSRQEALKRFEHEPYKLLLINDLPKDEEITYYQIGKFIDLCKGPHLPDTSKIRAIKLLRLAGAYWRGKSDNKMLCRLYGTSFPKQKQLRAYLTQLQEAAERDHIKIGKDLGLFITEETVGQGLPLLTAKGETLRRLLVQFVEEEEIKRGYMHVKTPYLAKSDLYKISGHWDHYKEDMFVMTGDQMALRPMTCPFHFALYNSEKRSYRDLPLRYGETSVLFRNEASGEMHGLTRLRQFTLADGHIICRADQLEAEFDGCLNLITYLLKTLDLEEYTYRFSKWDPSKSEEYIDDPKAWEETERLMKILLDKRKFQYTEAVGEAAFYGPKLDLQMINVHGKEDTAVTVQVDFALPKRFKMTYVDSEGQKETPIILHRSSIGCYERTMAFLIEKCKGRFPYGYVLSRWGLSRSVNIPITSLMRRRFRRSFHGRWAFE